MDADLLSTTNTTATLNVTNANGESTDRIQFVPSGVYTVVGSELRANNVAIATFTGGNGTTPFVVQFTTNMARIQAAIGLIGYTNSSDNPSTTSRVLVSSLRMLPAVLVPFNRVLYRDRGQ